MSDQQPHSPAAPDGGTMERLSALFSEMFTKSNIETDEYLAANMQPNAAFSLEVICRSPKVRDITTDEAVVEAALAAAPSIDFSDRTARPRMRMEQHSVILRDISPDVPVPDILKIFEDAAPDADGAPCPRAISARSDLNNTWFVSFASEKDTRAALTCIRSSRFNGAPVKARLKTESLNKAYYGGADRFGPVTPGSAPEYYSPGGGMSPMMMQQNMYYGFPGPGPFMPPPPGQQFPGMSPMGMPAMWHPQGSPAMVGQGFAGRQNKGGAGNMQNNRNNRNQQRTSPRNAQGRGYGPGGQAPPLAAQGGESAEGPGAYDSVQATEEGDEGQRSNAGQGNRRSQGTGQKKKQNAGTNQGNQSQNKRKDGRSGEQAAGKGAGKGPQGAGGQQKQGADGRRKGAGRGGQGQDAPQKGPNFNLNAADFPAAWEDSTGGKTASMKGGQKGSWTAALLGGNKATSSKKEGDATKSQISDAGAAAAAMFANDEHHSILVNSFDGEKRERHHSFSSDQHISFVPDAVDEPSHLRRVPTPIPSEEEVIERWQAEAHGVQSSPPPLHVNDTPEERHNHRIVPGTHVAKEMETLMFGSFKEPVRDPVEDYTNANAHVPAPEVEAPAAPAPAAAPGGKRSFMDVLKASKK